MYLIKVWAHLYKILVFFLIALLTPSQSVSHKRFHKCVNHKKKLSLRHPLPTFGSFSFFQASLWLGVDKILQKLSKSYKSEVKHLFQFCILIPRKCPRKTPISTCSAPHPPTSDTSALGSIVRVVHSLVSKKKILQLRNDFSILKNLKRNHGANSNGIIFLSPLLI